jgi:hypothetical protein
MVDECIDPKFCSRLTSVISSIFYICFRHTVDFVIESKILLLKFNYLEVTAHT